MSYASVSCVSDGIQNASYNTNSRNSGEMEEDERIDSKVQGLIKRERMLSEDEMTHLGIKEEENFSNEEYIRVTKNLKAFKIQMDDSDLDKLARFLVRHKEGLIQHAQSNDRSIFYPRQAIDQCLSFQVSPSGNIIVHPRMKRLNACKIGGFFKIGKLSLDPFTNETFLTQTAFYTFKARDSIDNEIQHVEALTKENLSGFIKPVSYCYYLGIKYIQEGKDIVDLKYSLVTPYVKHGDLSNQVENFRQVTHGILTALNELHDAGYLHLDIKPKNILLGEDGKIVLCDFGNVRPLNDLIGIGMNYTFAPPEWMLANIGTPSKPSRAIEVMDQGKLFDAYSLGISLYLIKNNMEEEALPWAAHCIELTNCPYKSSRYIELTNKIVKLKTNFYRALRDAGSEFAGLVHHNPGDRQSVKDYERLTSR